MAAKYRAGKARPTSSLEDRLAAHRGALTRRHRVRNADQLVAMVDELGFCFAFTESGDVPVPACFDQLPTNDQDRKWGWMWGWKDELAEAKRLYYGRLLAKKPTFVAMRMLPVFYATFGRAGEPDDHLDDIRAGRLSDVARRVVEFLAQRGETQTKRMRAELGISSQEGRLQCAKAVEELQRVMYVARVRAVGEGREDYNYTYDLFVRRYPETVRAAERLSSSEAMIALLSRLLDLSGGVSERQIARLFDWSEDRVGHAIRYLEGRKTIARADGLVVLAKLG